jgi:hypothetical protein
MEQIHLTIEAPARLEKTAYAKIRRTLQSRRFQTRIRAAMHSVFRRFPNLHRVHLTISS